MPTVNAESFCGSSNYRCVLRRDFKFRKKKKKKEKKKKPFYFSVAEVQLTFLLDISKSTEMLWASQKEGGGGESMAERTQLTATRFTLSLILSLIFRSAFLMLCRHVQLHEE